MKLSTDEKRRLIGALSYAIEATEGKTLVACAEYKWLRKKLENALRTEGA